MEDINLATENGEEHDYIFFIFEKISEIKQKEKFFFDFCKVIANSLSSFYTAVG